MSYPPPPLHAPMHRGPVAVALIALITLLVPSPAPAAVDPLRAQQWALTHIKADQAWSTSRGFGVTIAVVDTGIDLNHPDLAGKIIANYTCIGGPCRSGGGDDDNGHGTHVAGIAAAATGNGIGISGVAPDAKLISVKVLGSDGAGTCDDVIEGIRFAADKGADVINLSLGSEINLLLLGVPLPGCVDALEDAAEYARDKGAFTAIAAGNTSLPASFYASSAVEVVGATGADDRVASYSSTGGIDIFAPGGDAQGDCDPADCILSTFKDGQYAALEGTSMATPHVAGVAALLIARGYTSTQVGTRLIDTADTTPDGKKRVNAAAAVGGASPTGGGSGGSSGSGGSGGSASSAPGTKGGEGDVASPSTTGGVTEGATPRGSASASSGGLSIESESQGEAAAKAGDDDSGGRSVAVIAGLAAALLMAVIGTRAALRRVTRR